MSDLRFRVFDNLDSALNGGQFASDGPLFGASAAELSEDLTIYASDLDEENADDLVAHVEAWLSENATAVKLQGTAK